MSSNRICKSLLVFCLLALATSAFAGTKSAAKDDADHIDMAPPQVVEKGDSSFGARVGMGSAYDGNTAIGVNYEYMFHPNFGISGQLDYSSYSTNYSFGIGSGKWEYTAWTLAAMGNFHFDVFKVKNLDTFVSLGLAHIFLNSTWSSPNLYSPGNATASSTELVLYANVRYFFNSHWGILGSLGTGMGTIGIGVDYLF